MAESGSTISVALVDDQELFRAGIRMLIESQQDMVLAGEAANGEEAVSLAANTRPDVMLMDLRMPSLDGVAATRRIVADSLEAGTDVDTNKVGNPGVTQALTDPPQVVSFS